MLAKLLLMLLREFFFLIFKKNFFLPFWSEITCKSKCHCLIFPFEVTQKMVNNASLTNLKKLDIFSGLDPKYHKKMGRLDRVHLEVRKNCG